MSRGSNSLDLRSKAVMSYGSGRAIEFTMGGNGATWEVIG